MTITDARPEIDESPAETPHTMHVLDHSGDTTITWNPDREAEVSAAREMFARLRGNRYLAYRRDPEAAGGGRGETIHEFDPQAREIVMVPQTVGG